MGKYRIRVETRSTGKQWFYPQYKEWWWWKTFYSLGFKARYDNVDHAEQRIAQAKADIQRHQYHADSKKTVRVHIIKIGS